MAKNVHQLGLYKQKTKADETTFPFNFVFMRNKSFMSGLDIEIKVVNYSWDLTFFSVSYNSSPTVFWHTWSWIDDVHDALLAMWYDTLDGTLVLNNEEKEVMI